MDPLYPSLEQPREVGVAVDYDGPIDRLKQRKASLESELGKVNAALEALEKNPEVAGILQLVGKALRY